MRVSLQFGWVLATTSPFDGVVSHHTTKETVFTWPALWSQGGWQLSHLYLQHLGNLRRGEIM